MPSPVYHEDVRVLPGETLEGLSAAYGLTPGEWTHIWYDGRNADLVKKRQTKDQIQSGDVVHVPVFWTVWRARVRAVQYGALIVVDRGGQPGERVVWVQTVD